MINSFEVFISQIKNNGVLIIKKGINLNLPGEIKILQYSMNEKADYYSYNISRDQFNYSFSVHTPKGDFHNVSAGIFGRINIENAVAAIAASMEAGVDPERIIKALAFFKGIKRRFDVIINTKKFVFIDDYAHHPEELKAFIYSVKDAFPRKRITGIFQPHLFTRTRDFAEGFAENLSLMDDVILLDIYPAREEPLEGVTSEMIFRRLNNKGQRILCKSDELFDIIKKIVPEVLLSMGAGDIEMLVEPLRKSLEGKI
jgi:UDP-N-acetylmuramate--alanine ligase